MPLLKRILILAMGLMLAAPLMAENIKRLRLSTTTSTDNSGLLEVLHPVFEKKYGVKIDVIAVGTGKALRLGRNGDVDLVMVHDPEAEKAFVASGYGIARLPVMHNDFVLVGPANDPANVRQATSTAQALSRIAANHSLFISRGDDSGTHKKEQSLWINAKTQPDPAWHHLSGQGMGAVLIMANEKQAYSLTDRGTYIAFDKKLNLEIVYQGAPELHNPYHVILVNPEKHPHSQTDLARSYADFLRGAQGQKLIADFKVSGQQLFYPDVLN